MELMATVRSRRAGECTLIYFVLRAAPNKPQEQTGGCCRGSGLKPLALLESLVSGCIGGPRAACCSASTR